jgi:hypothetical protein
LLLHFGPANLDLNGSNVRRALFLAQKLGSEIGLLVQLTGKWFRQLDRILGMNRIANLGILCGIVCLSQTVQAQFSNPSQQIKQE